MLSPRGSLSVDERTNTLLVQDTAENLADIRRLVQTLDVPVKQVLIEARIVIVSDTFERDLGAQLGITALHHGRQQRPPVRVGHQRRHRHHVSSAFTPSTSHLRDPSNSDAGEPLPGESAGGEYQRQHRRVRCCPGPTSSIWSCRRRRTRARAKRSPRRASSRRTRSKPPSCRVSRFPIRNRLRAAPRRRNSRMPCCRSR